MRTLFLGSYGFGNLGDELCLLQAIDSFPSTEVIAFSSNPEYTRKCTGVTQFIRQREDIQEIKPERVVLGGGGVGFFPSIRDSLHWMRDAWRLGAECHIHNIGVGMFAEQDWLKDQVIAEMLSKLASCSVRDDISYFLMREWPVGLKPRITYYPERTLEADVSLAGILKRDKPILGISIIGTDSMKRALEKNAAKVENYLQRFKKWRVAPIVSTLHHEDAQEDDVAGFEYFRDRFLKGFEVTGLESLDRQWLQANMTPLRLKGVIGGLTRLLSQRKHNCIHAIGSGVPFTGIFPGDDDSILRILFSLRNQTPLASDYVSLPI